MKKQHPPIRLLETWIELARHDKLTEAKHVAIRRIKTFFGSISEAEVYLEKEKRKVPGKVG